MSKCCKCGKWWPHNWLCLKGLSVLFTVLFYLTLAAVVYHAVIIIRYPLLTGLDMWRALAFYILGDLGAAIGFLTISKILGVLRKIKKAVSPCCCTREEQGGNSIESVVEHESK